MRRKGSDNSRKLTKPKLGLETGILKRDRG